MAAPKNAPVRAVSNGKSKRVEDPFVYAIGDVTIELPSLTWISPAFVRRTRRLNQMDQQFTLIEEHLNADQLAAVDSLDPREFDEMCTKWKRHSGIDLGE